MARRKKGLPIHGWVMFNKPRGMGSTQAVSFVRRVFNARKAGHGGTLDPLAEGVLPIALGEATKTLPYMLDEDKSYTFTVKWGSETDTCDLEGEVTHMSDHRPSEKDCKEMLQERFIGEIEQIPPVYSALKIDGKRACDRVRSGEEVKMKARKVTIHAAEVLEFTPEEATISVTVSKGTYVRSLARDLGHVLGCYGHVTKLIRTKVNKFALDDCILKEKLDECLEKGQSAETFLFDVDITLADIPVMTVSKEEKERLKAGLPISTEKGEGLHRAKCEETEKLISLVEIKDGEAKPIRNFNLDE